MRVDNRVIKDEYYGELLEFIQDGNVTDINYDGKTV